MSRSDMLFMAKPCALLGGFGGMLPREFFFKWCNLVRFGEYFDQIFSLKHLKNYHFLYKNFKFIRLCIKKFLKNSIFLCKTYFLYIKHNGYIGSLLLWDT